MQGKVGFLAMSMEFTPGALNPKPHGVSQLPKFQKLKPDPRFEVGILAGCGIEGLKSLEVKMRVWEGCRLSFLSCVACFRGWDCVT